MQARRRSVLFTCVLSASLPLGVSGAASVLDRSVPKTVGEARPILRFSPTWALVGRCLVGGPDLVLSAGGAVELDVSRLALGLGYGYDKINYPSSGDHVSLDVHSHGPYVGLGIRFGAGPIF